MIKIFALDDFCSFKTITVSWRGTAALITPAVFRHQALASTSSPTSGYFYLALRMVVRYGSFSRDISILKLEGYLLFFFAPEKGVFTYFLLPLLWVPRHSLFASLVVAIVKPLRYTCIIVPAPGEYYCTSFCLSPHPTLSFEVLHVCSILSAEGRADTD